MPFAGGPQAQNETQRAGREVRLIRVRHDRRIEQRRGFERIFVREVGAQHQLPFFGDPAAGTQRVPDVLEAAFEELADFQVAFTKFGLHLLRQRMDFPVGKGHHLRADFAGALAARDIERSNQHARAVRMQRDAGASHFCGAEVGGFHRMIRAAKRALERSHFSPAWAGIVTMKPAD